ncbi:MAG: PQQ-binding-like beta-propeller repeat protein [Pirellulaceae bacterium]
MQFEWYGVVEGRRFPMICLLAMAMGTLWHPVWGQENASVGSENPTMTDPAELKSLWTRRRGEDWPQFLGPTGDGKSTETGLIVPWPDEGPRIVWQRRIGSGYGIGSVSQGRYYHFDRWDPRIHAERGVARLTCMNAETGAELWRFEYPSHYRDTLGYNNGPRCSPVIDGNRVYVLGVEGMLHCLNASNGKPLWRCDTAEKYHVVQNFFGVGGTPVVEGDLLICMVGGSPSGSPGLYESNGNVRGNGSGIVAFNKVTGEVQYEITDELASYASPQLATIGDRRWCFVFARGGLVAFDPSTGDVDFQYPWRATLLESVNASTPLVVGREVFLTECYQIGSSLLSCRPGGYELVWQDRRRRREKAMKAHWNTPIYVEGYVYGCSGRNPGDADLRCIEWKTGHVQWTHRADHPRRSSLMYVDGHFVCLGEFGQLQLIKMNPNRYEVISEVELRGEGESPSATAPEPTTLLRYPCWAAPILAHGLLYVRGDKCVVCLEVIPDKDT